MLMNCVTRLEGKPNMHAQSGVHQAGRNILHGGHERRVQTDVYMYICSSVQLLQYLEHICLR